MVKSLHHQFFVQSSAEAISISTISTNTMHTMFFMYHRHHRYHQHHHHPCRGFEFLGDLLESIVHARGICLAKNPPTMRIQSMHHNFSALLNFFFYIQEHNFGNYLFCVAATNHQNPNDQCDLRLVVCLRCYFSDLTWKTPAPDKRKDPVYTI